MAKDQGVRRTAPGIGVLMLCEAITLGVASYLHMQGRIPLGFTTIRGENFQGAATPEAVIGAVLAVVAVLVLAFPRAPRWLPVAATGFAILGVIVGMAVLLIGNRSSITVDLAYHSALMAALLVTLIMLLRPRPASSNAAGAPAVGGPRRAQDSR
ncbi:MAG TPA: hypothetical protein VMV92_09365 [Streptosporangiaceae bacterium]|nr:hypothetical protein [Streptosporangiaceae bacterium]